MCTYSHLQKIATNRAIMHPLEVYFGEPRVLPDFLDTVFAAAIALGGLAHLSDPRD